MGLEEDCIRIENSLTSKLCNMHLEIEKIKRDHLDHYGFQE